MKVFVEVTRNVEGRYVVSVDGEAAEVVPTLAEALWIEAALRGKDPGPQRQGPAPEIDWEGRFAEAEAALPWGQADC